MWKWRSARPSSSREAGYAPGSCNVSYMRWSVLKREYKSQWTLTRTKLLQVRTLQERDSGEGEQWEVAVETKAHGRKLILAATKKRSKQNEITMNRLLVWKDEFFAPSLPQSKQILAKITLPRLIPTSIKVPKKILKSSLSLKIGGNRPAPMGHLGRDNDTKTINWIRKPTTTTITHKTTFLINTCGCKSSRY